jgi:hypothetical protein
VNERVHTPMPAGRWRLERRLVPMFPSESDLEGALLLAIAKVESGWRLTLLVRVQEQEEE